MGCCYSSDTTYRGPYQVSPPLPPANNNETEPYIPPLVFRLVALHNTFKSEFIFPRDQLHGHLSTLFYQASRKHVCDVLCLRFDLPREIANAITTYLDTVALYYKEEVLLPNVGVLTSPPEAVLCSVEPVRASLVSTLCACRECRAKLHADDYSWARLRYDNLDRDTCVPRPRGANCSVCDELIPVTQQVCPNVFCYRQQLVDTAVGCIFGTAVPVPVMNALQKLVDMGTIWQ